EQCHHLKHEQHLVERADEGFDRLIDEADEAGHTSGAKAPTVVGHELTAEIEHLARPQAVHDECAPGLLPAIGAMATTDVKRFASDAVADSAAETSTGTHDVQTLPGLAGGALQHDHRDL